MLLACVSVARSSIATVYAPNATASGDATAKQHVARATDREAGIEPPFQVAVLFAVNGSSTV
jgi:hypothetical protein